MNPDEMTDEEIVERYEECGSCGHYPAYCRRDGSGCTAWTDETEDGKCACAGRKPPKAAPAPTAP